MCPVATRGRCEATDRIEPLDVPCGRKRSSAFVRFRPQQQPWHRALDWRALHHLAYDATPIIAFPSRAGIVPAYLRAALIEQLRVGRLEHPLERGRLGCLRLARVDLCAPSCGAQQ